MLTKKLRVGINGFGRIGRAIFRINLLAREFDVVLINDINPDNKNIAYQLKYDCTYGALDSNIEGGHKGVKVNETEIPIFHKTLIDEVPWKDFGVDLVIDASGVSENVRLAHNLKHHGIRCIVTHSPDKDAVDRHIIMGVNEEILTKDDWVISSSICDSTAFSPVMKVLQENFGIEEGTLTTLHPWLAYQNLVCGPSRSYASPGTIYRKYALGRGSIGNLIPKQTSCIPASEKVLDFLNGKFMSHSFRVPTAIVSCADFTVKLVKETTTEEVIQLFKNKASEQRLKIFHNNFDPLISSDYTKSSYSANIDHEFTQVNARNSLKMVLFYDNEWGYSSRVVDLVSYIRNQFTTN
tara:strand:+ start:22280 stop:23335 length:1056 start_codon:yes stop_codon:yes gene_type:complete